jgi:hypothetical protein
MWMYFLRFYPGSRMITVIKSTMKTAPSFNYDCWVVFLEVVPELYNSSFFTSYRVVTLICPGIVADCVKTSLDKFEG